MARVPQQALVPTPDGEGDRAGRAKRAPSPVGRQRVDAAPEQTHSVNDEWQESLRANYPLEPPARAADL